MPSVDKTALITARENLDKIAGDGTARGLERQAAGAIAVGDLWRAEKVARSALNLGPNDRLAVLTLAASLRQQCRFEEASRIYLDLIKHDSLDSDAYLGMADTTFAANKRPEAFRWLERAGNEGAQTALSLSTIAHRFQDWKDYPNAERTAARAVQAAPADIDSQLQLASIQVESTKLEDGYRTLDAILAQDPNNGLAHRLMAVLLLNSANTHQDINRARRLLERAVELTLRDADIYRSAAVVYREQRLYRLTTQAYDALLHLDPTSVDARYGLGKMYMLLGKADMGREQLALYAKLDDRQRHVARLSEDAAHHPLLAEGHAALARYLESSGDYARAQPQYQTAAGLAPGSPAIKRDLLRFYSRLGWSLPERKIQ